MVQFILSLLQSPICPPFWGYWSYDNCKFWDFIRTFANTGKFTFLEQFIGQNTSFIVSYDRFFIIL